MKQQWSRENMSIHVMNKIYLFFLKKEIILVENNNYKIVNVFKNKSKCGKMKW